jgi:putative tryptophan/tyrosine transport system substrate-binding protein
MKRRQFIAILGGAATAWPLSARAQQTKSPARIGMLPIGLPSNAYDKSLVESFRQGLREVGIVENRDVTSFTSTSKRSTVWNRPCCSP